MPIDRGRARQYLKDFDFRKIFLEEMGWDKYPSELHKQVDGVSYTFKGFAEKRGVAAFYCAAIPPDYGTRLKLDKAITKDHFQHLLVFGDQPNGRQIWQWMRREPGRPLTLRTFTHKVGQAGELLLQKLDQLVFHIEEEDAILHGHVVSRMDDVARIEKITKKFYERFKTEHDRFLKFVEGIPDKQMEGWYASVMINRLMFLFFIQAKGFLNGDTDYLLNKLKESRDRKKDDYYRSFLCPLFFQGFACKKEDRDVAVNKLLDEIPYLNGGLFQQHQIEEQFGQQIQVVDSAFDLLFAFFKEYHWHLDERENRDDKEINPDVLGYIFEKYINDRENMGAYYTREDITEYISKNAIIPFLLQSARHDCATAFSKDAGLWRLLRDSPDRYIHEALRWGSALALPLEIAAGISDTKARSGWNRAAPHLFAWPTETWREVVDRRKRSDALRKHLANGEVTDVNDLVTLNLDIRQFAQDVIQYCEGPELLRAIYRAIARVPDSHGRRSRPVSILDPTCGSGAFLFAALNILKPLYEACLERMAKFVEDADASGLHGLKKFEDFREILDESRLHPNRDYFILKSIIVDNLYGVDRMEEATEVCKLRLFLKLVAQTEFSDHIEPLPDIDFNIRSGNSLVGFARYADVDRAVGSKFDFENSIEKIEDKALTLARAVKLFREQQTKLNGTVTHSDKVILRQSFEDLDQELNDVLASAQGVKQAGIEEWIRTNKPLHWFNDFHQIMARGGFDVIIGNPPYVELSKMREQTKALTQTTITTGNPFAPVVERSMSLGQPHSRFGMIIPLSFSCTERMALVRGLLVNFCSSVWVSHFSGDANPSKLFEGVKFRLDIVLSESGTNARTWSSKYVKWFVAERGGLFEGLTYAEAVPATWHLGLIPKTGNAVAASIVTKLFRRPQLEFSLGSGSDPVYVHRVMTMFIKCFDFVPYFSNEVDGVKKSEDYKPFRFRDPETARIALAILNSSTFFFYFILFGDCFHCGKEFVNSFPYSVKRRLPRCLKSPCLVLCATSGGCQNVSFQLLGPHKGAIHGI